MSGSPATKGGPRWLAILTGLALAAVSAATPPPASASTASTAARAFAASAPTAASASAARALTAASTAAAHAGAGAAGNPYGDPNLVSMFDGRTLDGWVASKAKSWSVKNGAMHSNGTGRGWIYYQPQQVGSFRWIFHVRQVKGDHAPTVLIWGTTTPIRDALSAIQFQPPNGGHWDYRPGHNDSGGKLFTKLPHPKWDVRKWSQCEIVGDQATGVARMACCPLAPDAPTCQAVPVLSFTDPTAGQVGPLAIQIHNKGIQDEYRGLYLESPVADPHSFITD
jgi:hypothetical protein